MGRSPQKPVQSYSEMIEAQQEQKKNRIYSNTNKAEVREIADAAISQSVLNALNELQLSAGGRKIKLDDFEAVKRVTAEYMLACAQTATVPTMMGLARSLGYNRNALIWHMNNKPDKVTDWLLLFKDTCAEILAQNALTGAVHPIVSIFLEKACYDMRDTVAIETVVNNGNPIENATKDELMKRYSDCFDDNE